MSQILENTWYHRRVADSSAKACTICFKPSTSVLITPDNKDHFYVCPSHLKDRNFAIPDPEEAKRIEEVKKKAEMDKEIEAIKKEYEEKMRKRREKKGKSKDKDKEKEKEKDKDEDKEDEKEMDAKIDALKKKEPALDDEPRIFKLQKFFYQKRIDRIRNAEMAKRNRERLSNPSSFPSVPTGFGAPKPAGDNDTDK